MKRIITLIFLILSTSYAFSQPDQGIPQNSYPHIAESSTQFQFNEMQWRLDQAEFERQREYKKQQAAAEEAQEIAKREAEDRAEQARQEAEDRAAEIEYREIITNARNRTFTYQALAFLILSITSIKIIRDKQHSKEKKLRAHEKAGVFIGVTGVLTLLFALLSSSPWLAHLDFWQNLMQEFMTLDFWPHFQTKFVVFSCIGLILYGALVYLDILKTPKLFLSKFE